MGSFVIEGNFPCSVHLSRILCPRLKPPCFSRVVGFVGGGDNITIATGHDDDYSLRFESRVVVAGSCI